jgi:hypothetical protein
VDGLALVVRLILRCRRSGWLNIHLRISCSGKRNLSIRLGGREPSGPAGPATQRVRSLTTDCLAQSALGALNTLLKGKLFRLVEFLLADLRFAQVFESAFILLIGDVI